MHLVRKRATELVPGDVVTWNRRYALVVYNGPCDTLPAAEAKRYVEPQLILLAERPNTHGGYRQTHLVTYTCYRRTSWVVVHDHIRVQYPHRYGRFLAADDLRQAVQIHSLTIS